MSRQDDRHHMVTLTLVSGIIQVVEERKSGGWGVGGQRGMGRGSDRDSRKRGSCFNQEDP